MTKRRFIAVPFTKYQLDKQVAEHWKLVYQQKREPDKQKTYEIRTFMLQDKIENIDHEDSVYVIGHANLEDKNGTILNEESNEMMTPHILAYRLSVMIGEGAFHKRFTFRIFSCFSAGESDLVLAIQQSFAYKACEKLSLRGYDAFTGYGYNVEVMDPDTREVEGKDIVHKWMKNKYITRRAKLDRRIVWPRDRIGHDVD